MRRPRGLIAAWCLIFAGPAYCWWETGHQVVARIAAAHLTTAARTRVARILNVPDNPQSVADGMANASTWADETKAQTHTGAWHYIDLAIQDQRSDMAARCAHDDCAPARIRLFAALLKSQEANGRWTELDALRYLIHLVGDVHQPLHDISNADQGGNCELIRPSQGDVKNLHSLWDGGIVNAMDVSDHSLSASLEAEITKMSDGERQRLASGDQDDWVWESHELAIADIYQKLHIPLEPVVFPKSCTEAPADIVNFKTPADAGYIAAMKPVVRDQLTRAGLRLARMLNESL